jgi:hypothetical protein
MLGAFRGAEPMEVAGMAVLTAGGALLEWERAGLEPAWFDGLARDFFDAMPIGQLADLAARDPRGSLGFAAGQYLDGCRVELARPPTPDLLGLWSQKKACEISRNEKRARDPEQQKVTSRQPDEEAP